MENKENVAITSTAAASNVQDVGSGCPLKRKRSTVVSCLKEIINKDEKKEDEIDILRKINDNLEKLTDIQRRRLKLRQMELQIKYNLTMHIILNETANEVLETENVDGLSPVQYYNKMQQVAARDELDSSEVNKLFNILSTYDASTLNEIIDNEDFYNRRRRLNPYPVHQQLYAQQQQEQERRRLGMLIPTVRVPGTSQESCLCVRYFFRPIMRSQTFRSNIVQQVMTFIDNHSTRIFSQQQDFAEKCVICMSNYQADDKLRQLKCRHKFHRECIDEWLFKTYHCPICRTDIMKTGKIYTGLSMIYKRLFLNQSRKPHSPEVTMPVNTNDSAPSSKR
ncbi:hypothetical protein FQA39_LY17361 [Lamprigera yunnana]|nr:hypothetical protein FQA39_LY17361 [Lamprigera yunnana]